VVAGACGVYLNCGFGLLKLPFLLIAMPVAYRGLSSHRTIGAAWLLHAAWDLPHHIRVPSGLHADILVRLLRIRHTDCRLVSRRHPDTRAVGHGAL
jgi:hypothetical protein